jgi:hypothetical protein
MASIGREEEERRRILSRALMLAQSGKCSDYRAIGWAHSQERYAEARDVLGSHEVRAEFDTLCKCSAKARR